MICQGLLHAVAETFRRVSSLPIKACVNESMPMIERFVAVIYKQTTNCLSVNEARGDMFVKDGKDLENIPPTVTVLFQHILWASFIAGHA